MKKKVLIAVATILVVVISICVLAGCGQSRGNMIKHKDSVYGMIYLSTGQVLTIEGTAQKIYENKDTITIEWKDANGKVIETAVINKDQIVYIDYVEKNI